MPPKAQPGEGIVVVLDVGPGVRGSVNKTFLAQSKECAINLLQRKMFAEKCRDQVGVVLFGTDETDNALASGSPDQYNNITVMQEPRLVTWDLIKEIEEVTGGRTSADWLDALVVAMNLLHDPDGLRFSTKRIALLSDFSGEFSDDQTSKIIAGLKNMGIQLNVIGPEMDLGDDDEDDGQDDIDAPGPSNGKKNTKNGHTVSQNWNGKPKTAIQLAGEALVARIVSEVDGVVCGFDDAIAQLLFFEKRSAASGNWNTVLDIGPTFQISITGRIKVKHATPPTWKTEYAHDPSAVIIKETSYHRNDDAQTPVDEDEVIPGYKYGTTLVPFSDEDAQMKYCSNTPRSLSILGFTRSSNVSHHYRAGEQVLVITAREGDEAAVIALSAFIQALVELDYVGITRRIYNKNSDPVLGVLIPEITSNYECLIWIPLPFQEDVRSFTFPSLQRITEKFTSNETQAMDDLINAMDLTIKPDEDDEDDKEEFLDPTSVLNPQLQHYFNVLTHRALHEHDPIPAPADHVLDILKPPEEVAKRQQECAQNLAKCFPTKKIIKKTKRDKEDLFGSKEDESNKKMKADDDNDDTITASDLTRALITNVTTATPVQDFNALLRGEAPNFNLICTQMGDVILQLINNLGGTAASNEAMLARIIECLEAFRKESSIIDPSTFNKLLPRLKDVVTARDLTQLWDRIKEGNLGLISSEESLKSTVTTESATSFLEMEAAPQLAAPEPKAEEDDFEDLLDDL